MSNLLKSKFFLGGLIAIAFLVAGSTSAFTGVQKMGSMNDQVKALQMELNAKGYIVSTTGAGSPGMESMYFGAKTKAAVMAFQAAMGLTVDGVAGPATAAALAGATTTGGTYPAGCTSNTGFSTTTGMSCASTSTLPAGCMPGYMFSSTTGAKCDGTTTGPTTLEGGAGSLDDVQEISSLNDEEVSEGGEEVKVAGVTISADGSDLDITAMRLSFDMNTGSGSDKLDDYVDSVDVWMGSTKVGSADASDFSDDSNDAWNETINLDGAVVEENGDEDFYVTVNALGNIDSNDLGNNTWTLSITEVRFEDAEGTIIVDSSAGDLATSTDFSFETLATAEDVELAVSLTDGSSADDINDAHVVEIDGDTDNVSILAFDLEATGDISNIQDIPLTIIANGTGDVDEIASGFSLWMDGDMIDSADVTDGTADNYNASETEVLDCAGSSCTIHFDDIDFDMEDGDTASFEVKADYNEIDGTIVVAGDSLVASLGATAADNIEAEDSNGDDLGSTELTGTAIGEDVFGYEIGFTFELVDTTSEISLNADPATAGSADVGEFTHEFKITAFGGDISIDRSCEEGGADAADQGVEYLPTNIGSNSTSCSLTSDADDNTSDTGESWLVKEGVPETFFLTTAVTATADHFTKVYLESINWDDDVTDTSPDLYFTAGLGETKTSTSQLYLSFI